MEQNPHLNHLVESSFQGVNKIFVFAFENDAQRTSNKKYYLPNVEIKGQNVMIDGKNIFDQTVQNNKMTYENIASGQGDDYTNGFLLDYAYFRDIYKMIAIDLSKHQALDADLKPILQINFKANLDRTGNTRIFFFLEEPKETVLEVLQGIVKVL